MKLPLTLPPMMKSRASLRRLLLATTCLAALAGAEAGATTTNFDGTFGKDDQVNTYSIVLAQNSNVIFQTDSYGGGTLGGRLRGAGGFVPILTLFDSTGMFLFTDGGDATCTAGMTADPATGLCNDAVISSMLKAGTYTVALTEFDNFANGNLSAGFFEAGNGNFTASYCSGATSGFQEIDLAPCAQRSNGFAFTETATATTPEPSTLLLVLPPVLALFGRRRRRSA